MSIQVAAGLRFDQAWKYSYSDKIIPTSVETTDGNKGQVDMYTHELLTNPTPTASVTYTTQNWLMSYNLSLPFSGTSQDNGRIGSSDVFSEQPDAPGKYTDLGNANVSVHFGLEHGVSVKRYISDQDRAKPYIFGTINTGYATFKQGFKTNDGNTVYEKTIAKDRLFGASLGITMEFQLSKGNLDVSLGYGGKRGKNISYSGFTIGATYGFKII